MLVPGSRPTCKNQNKVKMKTVKLDTNVVDGVGWTGRRRVPLEKEYGRGGVIRYPG